MKINIWGKLSSKYDKLWVQKYSLSPSRSKIIELIGSSSDAFSLLDVGCATGQLLCEIRAKYPQARLLGIDKSQDMIKLAKLKSADIEFICAASEDFNVQEKFRFITCCHSFPYYLDKERVLQNMAQFLENGGKAIFIQASINSFYDRFVMSIIEKTAEKADYFSKEEFCRLAENCFIVEEIFTIKEKWFMPSICGFILGEKL